MGLVEVRASWPGHPTLKYKKKKKKKDQISILNHLLETKHITENYHETK
jgi:hypothetical protein